MARPQDARRRSWPVALSPHPSGPGQAAAHRPGRATPPAHHAGPCAAPHAPPAHQGPAPQPPRSPPARPRPPPATATRSQLPARIRHRPHRRTPRRLATRSPPSRNSLPASHSPIGQVRPATPVKPNACTNRKQGTQSTLSQRPTHEYGPQSAATAYINTAPTPHTHHPNTCQRHRTRGGPLPAEAERGPPHRDHSTGRGVSRGTPP